MILGATTGKTAKAHAVEELTREFSMAGGAQLVAINEGAREE